MKKLVLFAAVLMVSLFSINNAKAQVSLNINIGQQPVWGPTGYNHVDYYYFPDIDAYYYVPSGQYIYSNGGRWVWVNSLPAQYGNFDLYRAYKVVVNEPRPYLRNNVYVTKYSKFKNYNGRQAVIRDSRDTKYYVVKGHPNYNGNKTVVVNNNNNRPNRTQKTVVKVNQNSRPVQNNGRGNDNRGGNNNKGDNNRPERGGEKGNGRH
ncbi:hypothetical protein EZ449_18015 [Pedobacter frigidisoli]|uniref:Uncharacterized protein n=1 Tax=Pedobacter frigidisoli TaxID=2530455 RepID=A0A4R0NYN9_9SPHI|nr:hypothetical protein [Pedobacter frigidisoli]TCD04204.1 hypothetical protein EZ449_18015 [Pedobacter frigidisoli]